MAANEFTVRKIAGACGAEIEGVNLSRELDGEVVGVIRQAWLDHLVIVFRGQDLTLAQFMRFAERFGEPIEYPMLSGLEGFPRITVVAKLEHERQNFGGVWHSDTAYLEQPPMGTMLLAREVPPHGGDTLFANQYLAYETLSAGMKRLLDGLIAVNDSALSDIYRYQEDTGPNSPHRGARKRLIAEHPAVRTHPETGRKALYVNVGHTLRFKDMTVEESAPILKFLFQHQIQAEFTCRLSWQSGSLAFWDNRAAQHYPINDYHGFRRIMHRITLAGDKPR
jgi:taurine dioxygenase